MDKPSGFLKEFWKNDNYDDPSRKETCREKLYIYTVGAGGSPKVLGLGYCES